MKLVSYEQHAQLRAGILIADTILDLPAVALAAGCPDAEIEKAKSVRGALEAGLHLNKSVAEVLKKGAGSVSAGNSKHLLGSVKLGPPVPDPRKIICTGLNYTDHAKEVGAPIPEVPIFFPKYDNSLISHHDPVEPPIDTSEVDYEAELAIVIGNRCRYVSEAEAGQCIAGAMVFNDISARDLQLATPTWTGGKAVDTFGPCGPALVTLDEIGNLQDLKIKTCVDGRLVQDGSTADMVFSAAYLVSFLSRIMTLEPGDIIATGTPAGVGKSYDPPIFLKTGSVVEVEIEKLGATRNTVIAPREIARPGAAA